MLTAAQYIRTGAEITSKNNWFSSGSLTVSPFIRYIMFLPLSKEGFPQDNIQETIGVLLLTFEKLLLAFFPFVYVHVVVIMIVSAM